MTTVSGKTVNPGTRVYVRPVKASIATTTYSGLSSSDYLGGFSLSKNFDTLSNIAMPLVNTLYNTVKEALIIT